MSISRHDWARGLLSAAILVWTLAADAYLSAVEETEDESLLNVAERTTSAGATAVLEVPVHADSDSPSPGVGELDGVFVADDCAQPVGRSAAVTTRASSAAGGATPVAPGDSGPIEGALEEAEAVDVESLTAELSAASDRVHADMPMTRTSARTTVRTGPRRQRGGRRRPTRMSPTVSRHGSVAPTGPPVVGGRSR